MTQPKVYFVQLRRPAKSKKEERRDDPFYEFGSFGCTGCHSRNLLNPKNAANLEGARLAFVQGGNLGSRLVFLTPPITVTVRQSVCEARWAPPLRPFKYARAPILAWNDGRSDFKAVEQFACTSWGRKKIELGLSSRIRSRATPLPPRLAREVIEVYERWRKKSPRSAFARTYDEAMPWRPPVFEPDRENRYRYLLAKLSREGAAQFQRSSPKRRVSACCRTPRGGRSMRPARPRC